MATKNVESVFPGRVKHWKDLAILAILHLGLSPAQIHRADLTSVVFFPLSFVAIYSVNETYISSFQFFQILFFSVFLFLCSTFPLFYLNYIDKFVHLSMVFHAISNHQLLITVKTDLPLNVSCNQSDFCDS